MVRHVHSLAPGRGAMMHSGTLGQHSGKKSVPMPFQRTRATPFKGCPSALETGCTNPTATRMQVVAMRLSRPGRPRRSHPWPRFPARKPRLWPSSPRATPGNQQSIPRHRAPRAVPWNCGRTFWAGGIASAAKPENWRAPFACSIRRRESGAESDDSNPAGSGRQDAE